MFESQKKTIEVVSNKEESLAKINQAHSLHADLATGWRPKLKIIGPMPLNFDNHTIDKIIKPLIGSQTSLLQTIYLGARPRDTIHMHEILAKQYSYKYQHLFFSDTNYLKPFFHKFYSEFQPEYKRKFDGMNPNIKSTLKFQSRFQSGNLDSVIRTRANQYDLILRIDSNTAGHIMWYYFRMTNTLNTQRKVRLNIVNLRRTNNATSQKLRPYIKRKNQQWAQGGDNIIIKDEPLQLNRQTRIYNSFDGSDYINQSMLFKKLSFDVQLEPNQEVEIAYSIPYTYSQLLRDIRAFKQIAIKNNIHMEVDKKNQSLSGLEIPYLKIMQDQADEDRKKKKLCIVIIGRQHPGQSNGSHVLKGFIQALLSNKSREMQQLLSSCVFHIIPMMNPDGVVIGNFRTSLYGKDLNRLFKKNNTFMIPEVQFARSVIFNLSRKYGKKLFMFLDFHGHSSRRNAFCFAPSFLQTNSSQNIREYPKIIGDITEIFRFQSCSFRIPAQKKRTARAVFSKLAGLCYTIETSNWSYFSQKQKIVINFNQQIWENLGSSISVALGHFLSQIKFRKMKQEARRSQRNNQSELKFKKIRLKTKQDDISSYNAPKISKNKSVNNRKQSLKSIQHNQSCTMTRKSSIKSKIMSSRQAMQYNQTTIEAYNIDEKALQQKQTQKMSIIYSNFSQQKKAKKQKQSTPNQLNKNNAVEDIAEENQEDDEDSDGSQEQDMQGEKFKNYIEQASKMFIEFEKVYYGDQYNQNKKMKCPTKKISGKKQSHSMQQACLRYNEPKINESLSKQEKEIITPKIRHSLNSKIYTKIENIGNQKLDNSLSRIPLLQENSIIQDPKKQIVASLPRISIINYTTLDQGEQNQKRIFKMPKIEPFQNRQRRKL